MGLAKPLPQSSARGHTVATENLVIGERNEQGPRHAAKAGSPLPRTEKRPTVAWNISYLSDMAQCSSTDQRAFSTGCHLRKAAMGGGAWAL